MDQMQLTESEKTDLGFLMHRCESSVNQLRSELLRKVDDLRHSDELVDKTSATILVSAAMIASIIQSANDQMRTFIDTVVGGADG
jgi:hypothetical protein